MTGSWACVMGMHEWRQLPDKPGGVSRRCDRCGLQERVDWLYIGPGAGLGRVRTLTADPRPEELLVPCS